MTAIQYVQNIANPELISLLTVVAFVWVGYECASWVVQQVRRR